jgi:hypothetical protein
LWLRRTASGWRINLHAVVGTIILLGTPLFLGSLLLRERTTTSVLFATLGLLSIWYVVHPNLGLLGRWWENPWGKLFYALAASVTVTVGKIGADQKIRLLTQSSPAIFPSAQQAITVWIVLNLVFAEIGIGLFAPVYWVYLKLIVRSPLELLGIHTTSISTGWLEMIRVITCAWGSFFLFHMIHLLNTGFPTFNPTERLLLLSSFIPNDRGLAGSDLVCRNLPFDSLVSPFSPRDPIPKQVVIAQRINTGPDGLVHSYTYRVVPCTKPTSSRDSFP